MKLNSSQLLDVAYEDELIIVVNKPEGVLSQPGKTIDGSIATLVREARPNADGPLLVHRLDMDTSGLLMLAKSRGAHRYLQQQFEKRQISKRYKAILSRRLVGFGGRISVPLRGDLANRPVQIVCFDHGKSAETLWKCVDASVDHCHAELQGNEHTGDTHGECSHVYFYPVTGRSHQLRVHSASPFGLNAAILGDRLYGKSHERMYLHADSLGFYHPGTEEFMMVRCPAPF